VAATVGDAAGGAVSSGGAVKAGGAVDGLSEGPATDAVGDCSRGSRTSSGAEASVPPLAVFEVPDVRAREETDTTCQPGSVGAGTSIAVENRPTRSTRTVGSPALLPSRWSWSLARGAKPAPETTVLVPATAPDETARVGPAADALESEKIMAGTSSRTGSVASQSTTRDRGRGLGGREEDDRKEGGMAFGRMIPFGPLAAVGSR
jgi:hypothetical protein